MYEKLLEKCKNLRADMLNKSDEVLWDAPSVYVSDIKEQVHSAMQNIEDLETREALDVLEEVEYLLHDLENDSVRWDRDLFTNLMDFLKEAEPALAAISNLEKTLDKYKH